MIWRFGLFDSTFEPLLPTHWALLVALGLPLLLGMLAALFPLSGHGPWCWRVFRCWLLG